MSLASAEQNLRGPSRRNKQPLNLLMENFMQKFTIKTNPNVNLKKLLSLINIEKKNRKRKKKRSPQTLKCALLSLLYFYNLWIPETHHACHYWYLPIFIRSELVTTCRIINSKPTPLKWAPSMWSGGWIYTCSQKGPHFCMMWSWKILEIFFFFTAALIRQQHATATIG